MVERKVRILSIIPARGGSKGIKLKNLAKINEKSLLTYTINASTQSKMISRTIVSTDHPDISKEAIRLGAEVVKRPKKISGDKVAIEPIIKHVLAYLKEKEKWIPDIVVLLQNTSPLRTNIHIDEAIKKMINKKLDSILSVTSSESLLWKKTMNSINPINYDLMRRPNRQQMNNQLLENGAIYATKTKFFEKNQCRISGKIGFYKMPAELSYQIDTKNDLQIVEQIMKNQEPIKDIFSVRNKNIIITGSSGLLGSFYARELIQRGANLALIDINTKTSEQIKEEFKKTKQTIKVYKCDLAKQNDIVSTFKKICDDFESIDVLINNAAFTSRQTFHVKDFKNYEKHPFDLWKESFKVNIDAVHLCTQQVLGKMKKQKHGVIINISSTYGVVGPDFTTYEKENLWTPPGYAVTKSAILNFTRYVANLYGKYNIRCNTFTPSGVATNQLTKKFIKKYSARNAFKRMAKPEDYAGPIIFLCSDASEYMTGANLIVDAGWTAR